jgi:hypothetical protein
MRKKIIILSSVIIIMFTAGDIFSQPRGEMEMMQNSPLAFFKHLEGICFSEYDFMRFELELSDEQINSISGINNEFGSKLNLNYKKLLPLKNDLRVLLLSKEINLEKVKSKLQEISTIEIDIQITKIMHRIAIEKIFNNRQMEKLSTEKKWILRHSND